jgi:sulfatase maturation enzyme AslB (radical SAM superfamily)
MKDATLLQQLEILRDRHNIKSMLFMGGEPMIRRELVLKAMQLFEQSSIVTNGTYGIPSVPGHLVTVSLDGPEQYNDNLRGKGVFQKVKQAVFERNPRDGTTVMLQMTVTRQNASALAEFVESVADWPVTGIAFTFYVPTIDDDSNLLWQDLRDRDPIVQQIIELKQRYPQIKANRASLELMMSDVALRSTGEHGENCSLKRMLPLYIGDGGNFERTFCCYGNDVDCSRCGSYAVFNSAYHRSTKHYAR